MKRHSNSGSVRETSRWCTIRSRKSAAKISRGFGPSVTKQTLRYAAIRPLLRAIGPATMHPE